MTLQQIGKEQVGYWMAFPKGACSFMGVVDTSKATGDETSAKVRKPYTISKQRERWTEEEHQKFLEALKLYGRAWRQIEVHICTKSAVQIRSHAQKFFSKLEREASMGGSSVTGVSQDIEIPPPRPKRKPSNPYPKKAGAAFSSSPSIGKDSTSQPAICFDLTPVGSPTMSNVLRPLKGVLHDAYNETESCVSLRLFGQTVIPANHRSTYQHIDSPDSILLQESESTGSPISQTFIEAKDTSGISSQRSCNDDSSGSLKTPFICQPEGAVSQNTDASNEAGECDSNEGSQTWEKDLEVASEMQKSTGSPRSQISMEVEDTSGMSPQRSFKEESGRRMKTAFICQPEGPFWQNTNSSSEAGVCDSNEGSQTGEKNLKAARELQETAPKDKLSFNHAGTHKGRSCFTPWHPSCAVTKQCPATFAVSAPTSQHGLLPAQRGIEAAAAVDAATFAVESAWQAINMVIPTDLCRPIVGMVYNPVAIVTAASKLPCGAATNCPEQLAPLKQNVKYLMCARERGNLGDDNEHTVGSEAEDEPTTMQFGDGNSPVTSTPECSDNMRDRCVIPYHESGFDPVPGIAMKKRLRCSHGQEMNTGKETWLKSENLQRCHSFARDSPRIENREIPRFNAGDVGDVQDGKTVKSCCSLNVQSSGTNPESTDKEQVEFSKVARTSEQYQKKSSQGLVQSEVNDRFILSDDEDHYAKKHKEILDQNRRVCEIGYAGAVIQQRFPSDNQEGPSHINMPVEALQHCSIQIKRNKWVAAELTELEENGKNIPLTTKVKDCYVDGMQIGYGICKFAEAEVGKHLFMIKTGESSSSSLRYSGAGFVPYKRDLGVDEV